MVCVRCGGTVYAGAKFCSYCGTPIKAISFCPSCGTRLEADQVFCKNCGTRVVAKTSEYAGVKKTNLSVSTGKLLQKMQGVTKFLGVLDGKYIDLHQ